MSKLQKVRVFRRPNRLWHWWCPCCMGGDFSFKPDLIRSDAFDHVAWAHSEEQQ